MVVAVGLTLVDPLPDVDVKVPGVMAILVAPVVTQFSVLLAPESMLAGLPAKEVIFGAEPSPVGGLGETELAQAVSPKQVKRIRTIA